MPGEPLTFGFIGRHVPAKGVDDLIAAFRGVRGDVALRIWGRPEGQLTAALRDMADADARIQFRPEYRNERITEDVFNHCDAVVVPSRWCVIIEMLMPRQQADGLAPELRVENSPLVIHEAQQARLPVITADAGGMAEFVRRAQPALCQVACPC